MQGLRHILAIALVTAGLSAAGISIARTRSYTRAAPVPGARSAAPQAVVSRDDGWVRFTDVTKGSGLESFVLHAGKSPPKNWVVETIGGGLCAGDFDGDGDADLFVIDAADMTVDGDVTVPPGSGCRLFRNDGGFRFTDVTAASGAGVRGYFLGGAAADYDGDGDADLCVVGYCCRALLRNRGDGTFDDVTSAAGLAAGPFENSSACAWGDVDRDGRLDLFVSNYVDQRWAVEDTRKNHSGNPAHCALSGHMVFCGPMGLPTQANRLFLQAPDGTFRDAFATHVVEPSRASLQPVFTDVDDDGDLDLFVANDGSDNTLLVNDGTGRLRDVAPAAGVAASETGRVQGNMGVAVADFDADCRLDIAVTVLAMEYNALYRGRTICADRPAFIDLSHAVAFSAVRQTRTCWGIVFADLDGDSDLDCFISAGDVYDATAIAHFGIAARQTNSVLRNLGAPRSPARFEDASAESGPHFEDARLWRGAVLPDLDDDGDPDAVVVAQHEAPAVLRNDGGNRRPWIRLDLRPRKGLPTPAGARATVTLPDGTRRISELHCGSSYASSEDPRLHFGLGTAERVPRIDVRWPDGTTTTLADVAARRVVRVQQK